MKFISFFIIIFCCLINNISAQKIPYGISSETLTIHSSEGLGFTIREICYYKPSNYDSINSPILWALHGIGGDGYNTISVLQDIADKRNALIVAPTANYMNWATAFEVDVDTTCIYYANYLDWLPIVFKQIYKNVLNRENRALIHVYLTGFSAGGQCVTRYMLIRQAILDSIPIRMAVSISPYCTLFVLILLMVKK